MRADRAALTVASLALAVIELRAKDDPSEANTYGLPDGAPIRAELKRWFRRQRAKVLSWIPSNELPSHFPPLADYDDPMAASMTPMIGLYWDTSGKATFARLGLDPKRWEVTNPFLDAKIRAATFRFCESTNKTTKRRIDRALDDLRESMAAGLTQGEALPQLRRRVQAIFTGMTKWKAHQVAATEAARAVHAAQLEADKQSGVVAGVELLLSSDACDLCRKVYNEARSVRLEQAFAVIGHNPDYSEIQHPPIHPHCQCSMIEVLKPEYGGPLEPGFSETVIQPKV